MSAKSSNKQKKKKTSGKTYKTASEIPKIEELVKNTLGSEELKESLSPENIKEMVNKFAKENMDGIISELVGPDKESIKEMLGQQLEERPNTNPNRFMNRGNVGASSNAPLGGRNEVRMQQQKQAQQQRRMEMENLAEKATTVICSNCNGHYFNTAFVVKRVSPIISPSGEEMIIPIQTFRCVECNNVNDDFLPNNILNDIEK